MPVRTGTARFVPPLGADILPPVGARFSTGQDAARLAGPSSAPGGAVTVTPGVDNVGDLTTSHGAGTTFYLLAGTHTLGTSAFDQVIPKAGNTYVGAPGAVLSGQGSNRYAFTGSASGVTIKYLEVTGFVCFIDEFVCNHDAGTGWTFLGCNIHGNTGAGVGLGSDSLLSYCWIHDNSQYGFSSYKPPANNGLDNAIVNTTIDHCEIAYNGTTSDELDPVTGDPTYVGRNGGCKFWDTYNIVVTNNWIHHSNYVGLWADTNNVKANFSNNLIEYNFAEAIMYEISYNFLISGNTIRGNAIGKGLNWNSRGDNFPVSAIYISESGGDSAVDATYAISEIKDNRFVDNWGDLALWENADRFCNSPANTSGKIYMPRGRGATLGICNNPVAKVLTVTLTSGSPNFTVTSGTLESTDEGRAASGTGIPGGTLLDPPSSTNGFTGGYLSGTSGRLSANATSSGSVTLTLAAGTISTTGYSICRWKTQNVAVYGNSFDHNRTRVLGGATLASGVQTGKIAVLSQYGTYPAWSPYQGTVIQDAITATQGNTWHNNYYRGTFTFMAHDTGVAATFPTWQSTYAQDSGSVSGGAAP